MIQLCAGCKQRNKIVPGHVIYVPKGNRVDAQKIFTLRNKGRSVGEISKNVGVTPRRIWQILAKQK
jgi:hypothetical protein